MSPSAREKDALWDRHCTAAPRPRTPSAQRYSDRELRSPCNILAARVITKTDGRTELASTRAAWAAIPDESKARVLGHNYRRSRERISMELANLPLFNKWPPQR